MAAKTPPTGKDKKPPEHVEVFFDVRDGSYWFRLNGRFVQMKKSDLQMHLRTLGLSEMEWFNGLREIDWPFWNAMNNRQIDYAGALAGHRAGVAQDGKHKLLVTTEPDGVFDDLPKKGPAPAFFVDFIQELLPDTARSLNGHTVEQWLHFCHWQSIALRSLRRVDFRPGQVSVFSGPHQCGKSLLQLIITEVLGGRVANPEKYMFGEKFSADLAGAEHWQLEDPDTTTDLRTRRSFGNRLKECANNERFYVRKMHKDPISLPLFRRITLSVNDEPENIAIVPPLDPSIEDKINLYKCNRVVEAFKPFVIGEQPTLKGVDVPSVDFDRAKLKATIRAEAPLIRAWLLRMFKTVPAELRDNRFGIVSAHHPELLAELYNLAPETRLLALVDDVLFPPLKPNEEPHLPWTGLSRDLEKKLRDAAPYESEKVLRFFGACGAYLAKLRKQQPERISKRTNTGHALWTIKPPVQEKE